MRTSLFAMILIVMAPLFMSQPLPPAPPHSGREELASGATKLQYIGTVGDFEISVLEQTQNPQAGSGGINTTVTFTITYTGATYGNPATSLEFFAAGETGLIYDRSSFGCSGQNEEFDQRLFTGGALETSICFEVHPDDADVLSLGVARKGGNDEPLWLATTEKSVAGAGRSAAPVEITAHDDFSFRPDQIEIPANTDVPITLTNEGFIQHDLVIVDTDFATELLNNGESETLLVNLPAGTYEILCTMAGHAQSGMVGTLIVTEDGDTSSTSNAEEPVSPTDVSESVSVTMHDDFSFAPNEISISANTDVLLTVTNEGFMQHDLVILDTEYGTELLNAGESADMVLNLPPGTYRITCTVAGHEASGMVGTLIVE